MVIVNNSRKASAFRLPIISFFSHTAVAWIFFHLGLGLGNSGSCIIDSAEARADPILSNDIKDAPPLLKDPYNFWLPPSLNRVFQGAALVERMDFSKVLDTGVPMDLTIPGNEDVLLLYSDESCFPNTTLPKNDQMPRFISAKEATRNCLNVKVVMVPPKQSQTCLAIMGQWESYHVHKFMRIPAQPEFKMPRKDQYPLTPASPLRYVARNMLEDGRWQHMPTLQQSLDYYDLLKNYLDQLPHTLDRLRPLALKAGSNDDNAIVVLVCNWGQAELLFNFVCNARALNLSLDSVLLFATDADTLKLAESLGLTVFDVQEAFGDMPSTAARTYGDKSFKGMMMAKVYCVHLITLLGYNILFQDVDVVWYRNPLEYFRKEFEGSDNISGDQLAPFDIYFQDDGAHSPRYAPYSPNTGFYYVRHNWRTMYFFSVLARSGDLIQMSGSHQSSLNNVLAEQASSRGLRVKVFGRDDPDNKDFPGGFHFHKRKDYMKEMIQGKIKPFLFHMSWTSNKDNKVKFFQQLGTWRLSDTCINKKVAEIESSIKGSGNIADRCCLKEPNFQCHYTDKPSMKPCKKSPPIDRNGKSFW